MSQPTETAAPSPPTAEQMLSMYRGMVAIRAFEQQAARLYASGLMPGMVHLSSGQEAVAVGVCSALAPADYISSNHRGHGHCLAKGARPDRMFAELLGRASGYSKGKGGSMHIADLAHGNLGTTGIVGGGIPLAVGAGLSALRRGSGQTAACFFGDGALNQGVLFEAMNMAAIWSIPVLFVCENNLYGEFTAAAEVSAGEDYLARGRVFGIPSREVDGMDVLAVYEAASTAVERARAGDGPAFLLCNTYRFGGHHAGDHQQSYKEQQEREAWARRDPIQALARRLTGDQAVSAEALAALDREVEQEMQEAAAFAQADPLPAPEEVAKDVYAS